jgi:hypothetical protein
MDFIKPRKVPAQFNQLRDAQSMVFVTGANALIDGWQLFHPAARRRRKLQSPNLFDEPQTG